VREPEEKPEEPAWQQPGIEWVQERGGIAQCAEDLFKVTFSADPKVCRPALKKMGAHWSVYSILNRAVYEKQKEYERNRGS
jgi:hypothetical protein